MEAMRDSFIFHKSWHNSIKGLPAEEYKQLAEAIINYSLYGEEPQLEGLMESAFEMMRDRADNDRERWEAQCANGRKGGRPPKQKPNKAEETQINPNKPNENQIKPYEYDNEYVNDNDNVINSVVMNTYYPIKPKKSKEDVLKELDQLSNK